MQIQIDAKTLLSALLAVEPARGDSSRYLLENIHMQADNGFITLTATDGHRLHQATVPAMTAETARTLIKGESIKALVAALKSIKAPKRSTVEPVATVDLSGSFAAVAVACGDAQTSVRVATDTEHVSNFPNFAAVIPESDENPRHNFYGNPAYIADACKSAEQIGEDVRIQGGADALAPTLVESISGPSRFIAVVMPKRRD